MQHQTITISTQTILKAVLIGLLFWGLFVLHDLVLVVLAAIVIASSVKPFADWFVAYRVPRVFALVFIYTLLLGGIAGFLYFFLPPLLTETTSLLQSLPEYADLFRESQTSVQPNGFVNEISRDFSLEGTIAEIQQALSRLSGGFIQTVSSVFGGLFSFILILVLSFYLAVQEEGVGNFLRLITPVNYEDKVVDLWLRTRTKIGRWMQGQLLLGVIIGVLVFLGLTILGVPYAFLLAVLAGVMELIPLFGPIISAIPAVALGFTIGLPTGFMVLGLYIIIQQFENHLIYPLVVQKVVGISPIVVILALIIGGKLGGFLGMLLAVPLAAGLLELLNDIEKEKLAQAKKE